MTEDINILTFDNFIQKIKTILTVGIIREQQKRK